MKPRFQIIIYLIFFTISNPIISSDLRTQRDNPDPKYKEDTKCIQCILDAYYDVISGPIGQKRDFDRMRNLFHPESRLIYSHWNEAIDEASIMVFNNADEFIDKLGYLDKKGFYEHEISNHIHEFGSVIQVFSTYQFRAEDKSIPPNKGITSYELFYDGTRYWILSMFWMAENEKHKIPKKYLGGE